MMNKVPTALDNPVDALLLSATAPLLPAFRATGHTPNVLTTYSFAFGLLAVAAVLRGQLCVFAVCYPLSYFFDCMDGQFARRYNQVTQLGDWYDHGTDILTNGLLVGAVYVRHGHRLDGRLGAVLIALLSLLLVHIGCQQRVYVDAHQHRELLGVAVPLCPDPAWIRWTRFFGFGTVALVVWLLVLCLMLSALRPSSAEKKNE